MALFKAYKSQDELGANLLSELMWDTWIGKPVDPKDPVSYIKTILPKGGIPLEADPRITCLTEMEQEALYDEVTDVDRDSGRIKIYETYQSNIPSYFYRDRRRDA